jgi:hypothetical protein
MLGIPDGGPLGREAFLQDGWCLAPRVRGRVFPVHG